MRCPVPAARRCPPSAGDGAGVRCSMAPLAIRAPPKPPPAPRPRCLCPTLVSPGPRAHQRLPWLRLLTGLGAAGLAPPRQRPFISSAVGSHHITPTARSSPRPGPALPPRVPAVPSVSLPAVRGRLGRGCVPVPPWYWGHPKSFPTSCPAGLGPAEPPALFPRPGAACLLVPRHEAPRALPALWGHPSMGQPPHSRSGVLFCHPAMPRAPGPHPHEGRCRRTQALPSSSHPWRGCSCTPCTLSSSPKPKAQGQDGAGGDAGHSPPAPAWARPWAGSHAAPQQRGARRDGDGSPVSTSPLMTAACDRGQEQAARGHRPVSTGHAPQQGRGAAPRGQGDIDGW